MVKLVINLEEHEKGDLSNIADVKSRVSKIDAVRKTVEQVVKQQKKALIESKASPIEKLDKFIKEHKQVAEAGEHPDMISTAKGRHASAMEKLVELGKQELTVYNSKTIANMVLLQVDHCEDAAEDVLTVINNMKAITEAEAAEGKKERLQRVVEIRAQFKQWKMCNVPKRIFMWLIKKEIIDDKDAHIPTAVHSLDSSRTPSVEDFSRSMLVWQGYSKCPTPAGRICKYH